MEVSATTVSRETARRMRRVELQVGQDLRGLRLDAGVTLSELASIVGVHRSHIARIEAGRAHASIEVLTGIGVALGTDLNLRFFAGSGPRLHDRFQAPMVEAVIALLDPRWIVTLEVPVTAPARGVIDIVLHDRSTSTTIAAEVQSELRRLEEQIRWSHEKAEGLLERLDRGPSIGARRDVSQLLVLRSTSNTRDLARRFSATLSAAYPARCRDIHSALTTASAPWPGVGILWVSLVGNQATVLRYPPRGVRLGR
jgi:transcriptional regulator with XRE-family HTH domain